MTREEAKRYMLQWQQELKDGGFPIDSDRIQALRAAIEALSERTGKWEEVEDCIGDVHYKCNKCGIEWTFPSGTPMENNANFCPNCGARMCKGGEK